MRPPQESHDWPVAKQGGKLGCSSRGNVGKTGDPFRQAGIRGAGEEGFRGAQSTWPTWRSAELSAPRLRSENDFKAAPFCTGSKSKLWAAVSRHGVLSARTQAAGWHWLPHSIHTLLL